MEINNIIKNNYNLLYVFLSIGINIYILFIFNLNNNIREYIYLLDINK